LPASIDVSFQAASSLVAVISAASASAFLASFLGVPTYAADQSTVGYGADQFANGHLSLPSSVSYRMTVAGSLLISPFGLLCLDLSFFNDCSTVDRCDIAVLLAEFASQLVLV